MLTSVTWGAVRLPRGLDAEWRTHSVAWVTPGTAVSLPSNTAREPQSDRNQMTPVGTESWDCWAARPTCRSLHVPLRRHPLRVRRVTPQFSADNLKCSSHCPVTLFRSASPSKCVLLSASVSKDMKKWDFSARDRCLATRVNVRDSAGHVDVTRK